MPLRHMLSRRFMLVGCAILVTTPAAMALTAPTRVTVDVAASLEDVPELPLAMTVGQSINFDWVTIPNMVRTLATCRYIFDPSGALIISNSMTLPRNVNLTAGSVLIELTY